MITALANPQRFLGFSRWAAPLLGALAAAVLAVGLWRAFAVPPDYQQGDTVRILFVHVPAAELSLFAYVCLAGASFFGLVFRHALADAAARAAAPLGAGFTLLAQIEPVIRASAVKPAPRGAAARAAASARAWRNTRPKKLAPARPM